LQFFGPWTTDIQKLRSDFLNAQPFENIVIDNFLESSYAEQLFELFPPIDSNWHEYTYS